MKVTDELLDELKREHKDENFADGIILPDGDYRQAENGHLQAMMELLPGTDNEIWKMIPEGDSPLFWAVEKTGCVLTDYNSTVGMKMTPQQKEVFDLFLKHGLITEEYFDLTKQREKAKKEFS